MVPRRAEDRRRPRSDNDRPTGGRLERRESRPGSRHSHPRKKELAARAPDRQARPLEPVLDDPETPHNEARGCECPSMHLGARRAPTAETLTRPLLRSLSLPWISPPFPGGKGAGGNGRGAAAPLGAPSGSSPCAEYVRGRTIRARSPACLCLYGGDASALHRRSAAVDTDPRAWHKTPLSDRPPRAVPWVTRPRSAASDQRKRETPVMRGARGTAFAP